MSRSWKVGEPRIWRMFCDSCDYIDPQKFAESPGLDIFARLGWFVGIKTDRCPPCYKAKGPHERPSLHMEKYLTAADSARVLSPLAGDAIRDVDPNAVHGYL